jgi:adenylate cyclase
MISTVRASLRRRWEALITHPWLIGDPALPAAEVARRSRLTTVGAVAFANAVGAATVLLFALFALPKPPGVVTAAVNVDNLIGAVVYLAIALTVGVLWGIRTLENGPNGIRGWLLDGRAPNAAERSLALRGPLLVMEAQAVLWGLAVVGFAAFNAQFSGLLAVGIGLTVALGGVTTSAAAYLLSEMSLRPVLSRVLADGPPEHGVAPGVAARWLLAWTLGTGVPIVGLLVVAIVATSPVELSKGELVIATIALCSIALLFGAVVTLLAAYLTVHPIGAIRRALARVRQGDLQTQMPVWDATEVGLLQAGFNEMVAGLRERERIRDLFGRQVGEEVARQALTDGVKLGGEVRNVAVLFVDISGSTELAATRPPEDVVAILNRVFAEVVEVISAHGGWIDKFPGDAALAVFGAPLAIEHPAREALSAARALHGRLRASVPDVDAGIGVAAGPVVAGHIGTESRFEYTVIGDPVNEAARLTDLAKQHDGRTLASGAVVAAAGELEAANWQQGEQTILRGRTVATTIAWPIQGA